MARKKVDEWWYSVDAVMEQQIPKDREDPEGEQTTVNHMGEKKVKVDIYLEKDTEEDRTPPHTLKAVEFVALCKECGISMTGTDIECLRRAVWEKLDKKFEIQWFDYYKVDIIQSHIHGGDGTGFDFYWDEVWKGITYDGKELLREWKRWSRDGELYRISAWPGKFHRRDSRHVVACIPKNDMTLAGLTDFKNRLDLLREKLQEMIKPEEIMNTLANLSGMNLLPQSTAQVDEEQKLKEEKAATATAPAE